MRFFPVPIDGRGRFGVTGHRYPAGVTALDQFTKPTRTWFEGAFAEPTAAQELGWPAIAQGDHTLIHAPTGSGKTLAAFLWALDRLASESVPDERDRCRVLYISPMKALAYDIDRNLRAPLTGIRLEAERAGIVIPQIATAMRTGDTSPRDRRAMLRHPPDVLITTPESLYLMLTSQAREILRPVRWVIVDEIHAVAGSKRGSHLSLSLERLEHLASASPQRIGLSATQRPLEAIAEFLGGGSGDGDAGTWRSRPVTVVDAPSEAQLDIEIVVPVEDMMRPQDTPAPEAMDEPVVSRRSIWPAMYPRLLDLVTSNRSTLLFVNSRGLAERLAAELNRLAGSEIVQSHHGSVSREQRIEIESRLKSGKLRGVVATSTLELGIDMAAIDLVVLVESPTSVARGLQRVGRAGHQVGAPSVARVFPKHRGDLLETAVVVDRMYAAAIESTQIPQHPLDVLAQQIVAALVVDDWQAEDLLSMMRQAAPYRNLPVNSFEAVLDMLSGRYPSDEFAELRPRIVWDRATGKLTARSNARMLAVTNPGTIPDRGLFTVTLPEGGKVGELDEEMVYESRPGDVFVLGSSTWRINEITHDRVVVTPAPAEPAARLPFWHGDAPGRPLELGRAVGAFVRELGELDAPQRRHRLESRYRLDPWAAANLAQFIEEEREATGTLPTDRTVVVEQFRDEIGDWRTVVLSPFGARVHAPWAMAVRRHYRHRHGGPVDTIWSDDGIIFRFPDVDEPPPTTDIWLDPDDVDGLVLEEAADSALFTSRFREAAARALLLPRRRPGSRTPLWLQRRRAAGLLEVAKQFGTFPIVLETYREVLQDYFDLPALREVLTEISKRTIHVSEVALSGPSPFATSLMFDFVSSFMYEYDAPVGERRAAALTLDRALLRELLGDPQFRDLLDPDVITKVELELQRLDPDRRIGSADDLHDTMRWLGPLTSAEIAARSEAGADIDSWVEELLSSRRAITVRIRGAARHAAAEDVARLRDGLGVNPPQGVPDALLEPVADPVGDVVGRYARTHGPFSSAEVGAALGLPEGVALQALQRLEAAGRVASGGYRPGGDGREWVDLDVLRRLRRRSLAVLRSEVEAVPQDALGRFLPAWHGVGRASAPPQRVLEAVRQLQGTAIVASTLERQVMPARTAYESGRLDELLASGEVVWIGRGPLGRKDGRIALYMRDQVPLLHTDLGGDIPDGDVVDRVRSELGHGGASFYRDIYSAIGGDPEVLLDAIWDLVWAGEVTNDTLAPLRAFLSGKTRGRSRRHVALSSGTPPVGVGRWYLVSDLMSAEAPSAEERATAQATVLLDRHGVVTRDAVLAEGVPGGFAGLYPVLAGMEDTGSVRRGYFVEGLGGAQFALPGAVDRLRSLRETGLVALSATDPANPYGAAVPWPDHPISRPKRSGGSHVVLHDGMLLIYADRGARTVITFGDSPADLKARALASLAKQHLLRNANIESIDGEAAASSPLAGALRAEGFVISYRGLTMRAGAQSGYPQSTWH